MLTPPEIRDHVARLAAGGTPADCAEIELLMYFERSREAWHARGDERRHGAHPGFARYAAARLAHESWVTLYGMAVATELWRRYPPEPSWSLREGQSFWLPPTQAPA